LTTFIDHRQKTRMKAEGRRMNKTIQRASDHRLVHPQGSGDVQRSTMDQINQRASACSRPAITTTNSDLKTLAPAIRQKGARRSPGQDRKDQVPAGGLSPPNTKNKPGRSQSIEARPPGDTGKTRPLKTFC